MATVNTTETGCAEVFARQKRSQGKMKAENGIAHVLHVKLLSISLYCCCCTSNWSEKYCLQPSAQNMIVWAKKQNKRTTVSTPWFQAGWGKYYKSFLQHKGNDIEKKPIMMHTVTLEIFCNMTTAVVYCAFAFVSVCQNPTKLICASEHIISKYNLILKELKKSEERDSSAAQSNEHWTRSKHIQYNWFPGKINRNINVICIKRHIDTREILMPGKRLHISLSFTKKSIYHSS